MKIIRKPIEAAVDLGLFTAYPMDEFEETYLNYNTRWNGNFLNAEVVFIPNSDCVPYVGIQYRNPDGTRENWIYGQPVPDYLKKEVCVCKRVTVDELKEVLSTPIVDPIHKYNISASQDLRTFEALSLDELKELDVDLYYELFHSIRNDVDTVYLSKNPNCEFIGAMDTEGRYYIYSAMGEYGEDPGWFEIDFQDLFAYLE